MGNAGNAGDPVLVGGHHRGHNDNVSDFADFRGLDVDGQQREIQPAAVAGVVVRAEGDQHQQQQGVEGHHGHPVLRQGFQIDAGNQGVHTDAQKNRQDLNQNVAQVAVEFGSVGGAGDDHAAEARDHRGHDQQNPVPFLGEVL